MGVAGAGLAPSGSLLPSPGALCCPRQPLSCRVARPIRPWVSLPPAKPIPRVAWLSSLGSVVVPSPLQQPGPGSSALSQV